MNTLEPFANDASTADPSTVLGLDHDGFDVLASNLRTHVVHLRACDLSRGGRDTKTSLKRSRDPPFTATESFTACTRRTHPERSPRHLARTARAPPNATHRPRPAPT